MGVLIYGLVLYRDKRGQNQATTSGMRLKKLLGGQETDVSTVTAMGGLNQHPDAQPVQNPGTKWADGLRGLAAVGVVSSHICLAFFQQLITPTIGGTDGLPMLFQRPILRLVIQGQAFVALFFILMGFVNALKPLKLVQASQTEEALLTLAKSALTRSARLVLPAAAVTCLAWLACQLRLNEIARGSDAFWLHDTSRVPIPDSWSAITALKDALTDCWVNGENPYDQPQWALKWLLIGSFWIFCVLLMTVTTRPLFRVSVLVVAYTYSWVSADYILGTNIYFGILLAQVHILLESCKYPLLRKPRSTNLSQLLPFCSAIFGLYLMSYPSGYAQDAAWSRELAIWAARIAPARADVARFWASLGAQILCASIYTSPLLQKLLAHHIPCYLGTVSFSMYLLHGPLMRSILAMLVFGPAAMRGEMVISADNVLRYPIPARWTLLFTIPIFGVVLLGCVHAWTMKIEPIFARITKVMERFATGTGGDRPGSPLQKAIQDSRKGIVQRRSDL